MNKGKRTATVCLSLALLVSCVQVAPTLAEGRPEQNSPDAKPQSRAIIPRLEMNDFDLPVSEMRSVIERYIADRGSLARFFSVEASPSRRARMKQFYSEWLTSLAKLNFDSMSQDGRIDYVLFKNHLDHELRQLEIQEKALAEISSLTPFGQTITDLEDARRRMEPIDSAKTAALLTKLSKQIDAISKAVESGLKPDAKDDAIKVKKTAANRGVAAINSLRATVSMICG